MRKLQLEQEQSLGTSEGGHGRGAASPGQVAHAACLAWQSGSALLFSACRPNIPLVSDMAARHLEMHENIPSDISGVPNNGVPKESPLAERIGDFATWLSLCPTSRA